MTQVQTNPSVLANAPCHTVLSCTDINQAREFYANTLGLNIIQESAEHGIMFGAGGGSQIYVYPREQAPQATNTVASFTVENVTATVEALQAAGVTFEEYDFPGLKTVNGIADMGDGNQGAWFTDPFGNIIAVSSM